MRMKLLFNGSYYEYLNLCTQRCFSFTYKYAKTIKRYKGPTLIESLMLNILSGKSITYETMSHKCQKTEFHKRNSWQQCLHLLMESGPSNVNR